MSNQIYKYGEHTEEFVLKMFLVAYRKICFQDFLFINQLTKKPHMKKFKNVYYAVMTAIAIVQILLLISLLITAKMEYLYGVTLLMIVAAAGIIFYDKFMEDVV